MIGLLTTLYEVGQLLDVAETVNESTKYSCV
jgi:hypothetical protein